jgi:hypothetical protein
MLATVTLDGAPRARTLVLRAVEPGAGRIWLHSDSRAAKIAEIETEPRVALGFWDPVRQLQLRLEGRAGVERDGEAQEAAWARAPEAARRNYASVDPPGANFRADELLPDGRANFAMIRVVAARLEWLWLGKAGHVRGESRFCEGVWQRRRLQP